MDKTVIYVALSNAAILLLTICLFGGVASLIRKFSIKTYAMSVGGKAALFIDNRLTFIGIIHHELAHALLALITGAKVKKCNLFKIENGTLGRVDITARGPFVIRVIQQTMTGIAPIICGCFTLYIIYYYGFYTRDNIDWITGLMVILAMSISYHMSMSKQDIKVARGGFIFVYLIILVGSIFIELDYNMYREYVVIILSIMAVNFIIALVIKIIASIIKH